MIQEVNLLVKTASVACRVRVPHNSSASIVDQELSQYFLNADELKGCGILPSSYSRAKETLMECQLLRIAAYKTINGYDMSHY